MSSDNSPPSGSTGQTRDRRASFSPGQALTSIFARTPAKPVSGTSAYPGPITAAAASAQSQRRVSISTLGLSGCSPTQTSPFTAAAASRRESVSSAGTSSAMLEESAVEDGDAPATSPVSPLARRMSFGARALRDARTGVGTGAAGATNTEGFNWSDSLRSRAQRASSVSISAASTGAAAAPLPHHHRTQSVSSAAPPPPLREVPKAPVVPDAFQERILKGDFYMD